MKCEYLDYDFSARGTISGYFSHLLNGEFPCDECQSSRDSFSLSEYHDKSLEDAYAAPSSVLSPRWVAQARVDVVKGWMEEEEELIKSIPEKEMTRKSRYAKYKGTRRALLKGLPSEPYSIPELIARDGTVCYLCGGQLVEGFIQFDHVVPISHPDCPGDILSNVKLTHDKCNNRKKDRLLEDLSLPFAVPVYDSSK